MLAKELIGQKVTRTAPSTYPNGVKDSSYMGDVLTILNANEFMIAYKHEDGLFKGKMRTLNAYWCDDNWEPIDEFIESAENAMTDLNKSEVVTANE